MLMEQITNKCKSATYLCLWLKAFKRKLLESHRNVEEFQLIANIVLNKIPVFENKNAEEIFVDFEDFVLTLLSINTNYFSFVFNILFSNLIPEYLCLYSGLWNTLMNYWKKRVLTWIRCQ